MKDESSKTNFVQPANKVSVVETGDESRMEDESSQLDVTPCTKMTNIEECIEVSISDEGSMYESIEHPSHMSVTEEPVSEPSILELPSQMPNIEQTHTKYDHVYSKSVDSDIQECKKKKTADESSPRSSTQIPSRISVGKDCTKSQVENGKSQTQFPMQDVNHGEARAVNENIKPNHEVAMSPTRLFEKSDCTQVASPMSDCQDYELAPSPTQLTKAGKNADNNSDSESTDSVYVSGDDFEQSTPNTELPISPEKGFKVSPPSKWAPKIQSVSHISDAPPILTYKEENSEHLVLVSEDEIKQEAELLDENEDFSPHQSEFKKPVFSEYPDLIITDEYKFLNCCVKLEKFDVANFTTPINVSQILKAKGVAASKNTYKRRSRGRKKTKNQSRQKNKSKKTEVEAVKKKQKNTKQTRKTEKSTNVLQGRTSRRLSGRTPENGLLPKIRFRKNKIQSASVSRKVVKATIEAPKKNVNCTQNNDIREVQADRQFNDSFSSEALKNRKVPYRNAIEKYLKQAKTYERKLDKWYECLCCDRKYHLLEQCKEHVRGHFPGMATG